MKALSTTFALVAVLAFAPVMVQAKSIQQAQTAKETKIRSCPNALCPVVKTLPKDTKLAWVLKENGFVNIADTTFWVAVADLK